MIISMEFLQVVCKRINSQSVSVCIMVIRRDLSVSKRRYRKAPDYNSLRKPETWDQSPATYPLLHVPPVRPSLQIGHERHGEVVHIFHRLANQLAHSLQLLVRRFEEHFVVDLKDHLRFELWFLHLP